MIRRALLFARTVRHLEPEQMVFQALRRVQGLCGLPGPSPDVAVDDAHAASLAARFAAWGEPLRGGAVARANRCLAGDFDFVGTSLRLPQPDWRERYVGPLWTYNLHYFDYARDLAWAARETGNELFSGRLESLAGSWMTATAAGAGAGWAPYPLSLRVVNWIYAALVADGLDPRRKAAMLASVHRQLSFLERRVERHILGNHLVKNLVALVIGGLLFRDARARRWLDRSLPALWAEIDRQVNDDGGHVERSPMYHAIVMADLLEVFDALHACGVAIPEAQRERVSRMPAAWKRLSRRDGSPRSFNDSASGIAPDDAYLARLASLVFGAGEERLEGPWCLPDTGFHGWRGPEADIAIDAGAPAPPYQPAHAHSSLLGFELELGGRPVIVDSGVHGYDHDPFREYVRSTRAHSTVMIDGREQNEMWGTFRVARRARMRGATSGGSADSFEFHGSCSPYHDRRARHMRDLRLSAGGCIVTDVVDGAGGARLDSYLHLHPDFQVEPTGDGFLAAAGEVRIRIEPFGHDASTLARGARDPVQGWYFDRFGLARDAAVVGITVSSNDGRRFGFSITRARG